MAKSQDDLMSFLGPSGSDVRHRVKGRGVHDGRSQVREVPPASQAVLPFTDKENARMPYCASRTPLTKVSRIPRRT